MSSIHFTTDAISVTPQSQAVVENTQLLKNCTVIQQSQVMTAMATLFLKL